MASMNTLGAVVISDGGVPRTYTAVPIVDVVAGEFVVFSGTQGNVSSGANSFNTTDVTVNLAVAGNVNGFVVQGATSGNICTYIRRADVPLRAGGTLVAGAQVELVSGTVPGVVALGSATVPNAINNAIGRVVTTAASGTANYGLISLNL